MSYCNAPQCERCWMEKRGEVSINEEGNVRFQVATPVRLTQPELEVCAWCGEPTIFGVYVRARRDELTHPPEEE